MHAEPSDLGSLADPFAKAAHMPVLCIVCVAFSAAKSEPLQASDLGHTQAPIFLVT